MNYDKDKLVSIMKEQDITKLATVSKVDRWKLYRARTGRDLKIPNFYEVCGALGMTPNDFILK